MLDRFISVGFLIFIGASSLLLFLVAFAIWLCTVSFDKRLFILHMFTSFWGCLYLWTMPAWSVSIQGRGKIKRNRCYIIVSNHQSLLDILVAFRIFFPFKWVSKKEIFRVPLIGWNMVLNRYIRLKRGDKESIAKMMSDCEKTLSKGSSIYLFPEGTRSKTGQVKPFKPGAFILAHKMKLPILVISINGTKDALPKHSLDFHGRHEFLIKVLSEIPYDDFKNLSVEETAEMIRTMIAKDMSSTPAYGFLPKAARP